MLITERIFDLITNEEILFEREETSEEIKFRKAKEEEILATQEQMEKAAAEKAALLAKLGITEDEAKLLLS